MSQRSLACMLSRGLRTILEDNQAARIGARGHVRERIVDLGQWIGAGHQLVQLQLAGSIEPEQPRNVGFSIKGSMKMLREIESLMLPRPITTQVPPLRVAA